MDFLRKRLVDALNDEIDRRIYLLRGVSPTELEKAQGHINGLEQGLAILDECFQRASTAA